MRATTPPVNRYHIVRRPRIVLLWSFDGKVNGGKKQNKNTTLKDNVCRDLLNAKVNTAAVVPPPTTVLYTVYGDTSRCHRPRQDAEDPFRNGNSAASTAAAAAIQKISRSYTCAWGGGDGGRRPSGNEWERESEWVSEWVRESVIVYYIASRDGTAWRVRWRRGAGVYARI